MKEPRQTSPVEWGLIVALIGVAAYVLLEWLHLPARSIMIAAGVLFVMGGAWVALAYASATIAKRKGYSFRKYFVLTLVGGFLALAGVLALPKLAGAAPKPREGILSDQRGIVTVEAALILTLLVLPVGLAVAKWNKPVVAWVTKTGANLERNSALQEENNALLKALLEKQGGTVPSPSPTPTPGPTDPVGTDPRPRYVQDDEYGNCPSGYARNNGVCTLQSP